MSTDSTDVDIQEAFAIRDTAVSMDPRLQRVVNIKRHGFLLEATASAAPSEIAVVAEVRSAKKWEDLSEVRNPLSIGGYDREDRTTIVTGRVPLDRIEYIRGQSFVKSLKAAQPMQLTLAAGVQETSARPSDLPVTTLSNGGQDVVVGIIDYGCDYAHRNFLDGSGKTRIEAIWHQGGGYNPFGDVPYGREYLADKINAALLQPDPYQALGYAPPKDWGYNIGTHGTHVMDIAAGNGFGSDMAGFAPNASLVFVDVSHADIDFSGPGIVDTSFGDSVMLLEAVQYIFDKAGDRPCVINISLGTNGGPHDGSTPVEKGIDRMLADKSNRAVTIAASNSYDDGIHAAGQVPQGEFVDLAWHIKASGSSDKEMDIWYSGGDRLDMELISPSGDSLGVIPAGGYGDILDSSGTVQVFAVNRLGDPNNGDNMIGIFLDNTIQTGTWTVRLHGRAVTDGSFHAWIERDNTLSSSFAPPFDNTHTIGSISCGHSTIVVGSYDAHKQSRPISYFSSAGPTRDGRQKPEISAPGHAVYAAHSRTGTQVVSKNGTSMAAPAVAGIIALMFAEARVRGMDLTVAEVREILAKSVNSGPPTAGAWDSRYGLGRINASMALAEVQTRSAGPLVASTGRSIKTS